MGVIVLTELFVCAHFQPFQANLALTTDPDKKQMLERLDAAVAAALQPLQAAMEGKAAQEVVQPLAEVRLRSLFTDGTYCKSTCDLLDLRDRECETFLTCLSEQNILARLSCLLTEEK